MRLRYTTVIIALYLLAVAGCIFFAFDFNGRIDPRWTLILIALTLPWSVVSFMFSWALIHGAGLGCFSVMYLVFAVMNAGLFYYVSSRVRSASKDSRLDDGRDSHS